MISVKKLFSFCQIKEVIKAPQDRFFLNFLINLILPADTGLLILIKKAFTTIFLQLFLSMFLASTFFRGLF